ncbi:B12-binding domain-containing radical SAM protein [Paenibacillus alkaliterrae]|uniref:B12-binding domain-containing radical SAM protein n=1 Tax=Paenibacillus alkaliterrae TaxID=320909 RepID=UPI001F41A4A4|nr:B12-binding domain-containing radical SAM protein [Paenibacillus alkaliterrae]MCF2938596.1 B12-binding domain-containing radical SAM protein [Paenibacillus alkaliterrae]
MKVVLSTLNAKFIHTSLALRCLKAYSGERFDIDIAEYTIKDPSMNIVSDIFSRKPDVVGFSCYIWNIEETITVINMLRKIMPDIKIILGGPEVSYDMDFWMNRVQEVDFIVVGEGEETFHHLLAEIEGEGKYHMVFGVTYRKQREDRVEVIVNPPRPKLNLNELPSPHRFQEDIPHLGSRVVYFETSRGCPFSCQFCLSSIEVGVRYYDMERTKADILYLIDSGAKLIKFVDRTFNIKRDYALEIFGFLIENHRGCVFQFEITADIMRPEVLDYLAEHAPPGIFRFEIGVQSTNDPTNEAVQRRQNWMKLVRTVMKVKNSQKIDQHLDLIAGLPLENYDTFRGTFNDVFELRPEELQLGFLKMLRGTGLRRDADKWGYIYMDRAPYEMLGNDLMPFGDIVRIKRVEDVLEKYWNAHRMDRTLLYLVDRVFPSPFDFFQAFGDFWERSGWQKIGHQLEDLFSRLWAFLDSLPLPSVKDKGSLTTEREDTSGDDPFSFDAIIAVAGARLDPDVVFGLMKYDYFLNHNYKPRKTWWDFTMDKAVWSGYMRRLAERPGEVSEKFAALGLNERELQKHAVIERLPFDLDMFLATGEVNKERHTLLAVLYAIEAGNSKPKARPFMLTMEAGSEAFSL